LRLACEACDRAHQAQKLLDKEGLTISDRFAQTKEHPAAALRATAETSAARLLKQLGLHVEAERDARNQEIRSGKIRSLRRREA
jgi:P27 family predicted phage terminase small subunit